MDLSGLTIVQGISLKMPMREFPIFKILMAWGWFYFVIVVSG